ncbi:MAG TPA: hypothetical protein ENK23_03895, partial [Sorangium sp.]|nr:hypothetical protein [Sorangium sp.]
MTSADVDSRALPRRALVGALLLVSLVALVLVLGWLRLDPNVASLLPEQGEAAALRRYLRGFGGSDLSLILIRSDRQRDAATATVDVAAAADELAAMLEKSPSVERAAARLDTSGQLDPWLVWRHADGPAQRRLAAALTPAGMRRRLRTSRDLLLAPGAGSVAKRLAQDPLRLQQLLVEARSVGSGFRTQADGSFSSDDGRARLVLVFPAGQALRGADAKRFVMAARAAIARVKQAHPKLSFGLTGGHAIAQATERMLVSDLQISSTLSMILASLAFVLTFRRLRALIAVMPPLLLGTLWTAAVAALLPGGLSAIGISFMSVV